MPLFYENSVNSHGNQNMYQELKVLEATFHRQWTGCMKRLIIRGAMTLKLLPSQCPFMRGGGKVIFQNLFLSMYGFQHELKEKDSWREDRLSGGQACQNKKYQSF